MNTPIPPTPRLCQIPLHLPTTPRQRQLAARQRRPSQFVPSGRNRMRQPFVDIDGNVFLSKRYSRAIPCWAIGGTSTAHRITCDTANACSSLLWCVLGLRFAIFTLRWANPPADVPADYFALLATLKLADANHPLRLRRPPPVLL